MHVESDILRVATLQIHAPYDLDWIVSFPPFIIAPPEHQDLFTGYDYPRYDLPVFMDVDGDELVITIENENEL